MGRSTEGDAHILGIRRDTITAASVKRLVIDQRHDKQLLLAMKGVPSDSKAANGSIPREASQLQETLPAAVPSTALVETLLGGSLQETLPSAVPSTALVETLLLKWRMTSMQLRIVLEMMRTIS